jgi:hypothetical protein
VSRSGYARSVVIGLVAFGIFVPVGCGKKGGELPENEAHLKALTIMHGKYVQTHRGMGPTDEADFKKFIKTFSAGDLAGYRIDVNDLEKSFTSPRDNQPYGVAYRVKGAGPGSSGGSPMVVWEQAGSGGKRFVSDSLGKIEEIDEAEFNKRLASLGLGKK